MSSRKLANFSPGRTIITALLCTIFLGTVLLSFSFAQKTAISLLDLIFTVTSLTCVTGLFTVPLTDFSFFGHIIILILMQLGGLGIITMTLLFMYLIVDVGFATQLMAGQLLEIDSWPQIKRLLIFIVSTTFIIEFVGTLLLLPVFWENFPFLTALFLAFFHAVSIFCNAGVWLLDTGSISTYSSNSMMLIIMTFLIFVSDIGFMTWYEIGTKLLNSSEKRKLHLSLQSRIVLQGTFLIVLFSSVLFLILEWNHVLAPLNIPQKFLSALFHGNSIRSTGMPFDNPFEFHPATLFMIMIVGFIGCAPLSTGSGVKITTVAVFIAMIRAVLNGRFAVEMKGRSIPLEQAHKAVAIIFLSLFWIIISTFILLLTETGWSMNELLFETFMALTNVGIATGVTPTLSLVGKVVIMCTMIIGRIGSLTLLLAVMFGKNRKIADFSYPEERVTLG